MVQLNEYKTDLFFLQNFQSTPTVGLIFHVFCKSCEPEIVLAVLQIKTKKIHVRKPYKTREWSNKLSYCFGNFDENINLSRIFLAVLQNWQRNRKSKKILPLKFKYIEYYHLWKEKKMTYQKEYQPKCFSYGQRPLWLPTWPTIVFWPQ